MGAREMIATKYEDNDPLSEVESHPEYMRLIAFQNRELMRLVSSQVQDRIRLAVEIRKEMGA